MPPLRHTSPVTDPASSPPFTSLYVTTLLVLALLLTVGQGLTQWRLSAVQDELWIIRYTALQRHQSQRLVSEALQVVDARGQAPFRANQHELRTIFNTFEQYHQQTRQGHVDDHNVAITNSDSVQYLYKRIWPHFEAIRVSVRSLLQLADQKAVDTPGSQASLRLLLANEKPFLEQIDGIVQNYTGELRQRLNRLQRIEFYLYLLTLAVLAGIGAFIFRPAVRKLRQTIRQLTEAEKNTATANKQLLSLNETLETTRQQLFDATRQQYQQEINNHKLRTSYLVTGQEEERKRVSRELHDGLGQMLTAIKFQVESLEVSLNGPAGATTNLAPLKRLITQTIQETRMISNNLMPSVLSDFGIVPALKMLTETNGRAIPERQPKGSAQPPEVTFQTNLTSSGSAALRLDKNMEITLYRVSQEAINNALRHGNPTHITIELLARGNYLHLLITDDGSGFQLQRLNQPHGQGLYNMQERVKLLNGKFRLTSAPGQGTKVQVSVPYQYHSVDYDYDQTHAR